MAALAISDYPSRLGRHGDALRGKTAGRSVSTLASQSMELHTWLIYVVATTGLSLSPGPNGLLALTHGALHGRRKALYTIFGGALGFVAVIALVDVRHRGLAQDFAAVAHRAEVDRRRLPGVARRPGLALAADRPGSARRGRDAVGPLHVPARRAVGGHQSEGASCSSPPSCRSSSTRRANLFVQFAIMAGTFAVIEIATELFIASMAHRISPWLARVGRRFNQACGGVFIAIGVALPLRS